MEIVIKTDRSRYHYHMLKMLQPLPRYSKLTDKEIQVLAQLLKHRDAISELEMEDHLKNGLLFSKQTRDAICLILGMDGYAFRNYLTSLRKKGFIKDNKVILPYEVKYLEEIQFKFAEAEPKKT